MEEIPRTKEGETVNYIFRETFFLKRFKSKKESSVQKYLNKLYVKQENESQDFCKTFLRSYEKIQFT